MKKEELKTLIKPLIKECLKEVLIEEGFTKMLSESINNSTQRETFVKENKQEIPQKQKVNLNETRKKMLDSIGNGGFDAFAGTQPLREDKEIVSGDPGVDISSLMPNKQMWKQTLNAMNGKKAK